MANRGPVAMPPADRFWRLAERGEADQCWPWRGAVRNRYGVFAAEQWERNLASGRYRNRVVHAHRFAYELLVGPIAEGMTIDHLCYDTLCVNPRHMEQVTLAENIQRGAARRRAAKLAAGAI